jgi:hypothetical protein
MSDDAPLARARDDLTRRSSEYGHFELAVSHIAPPAESDEQMEFLLVGVNTDDANCERIYESWLADHPELQVVSVEAIDELPHVEVRELVVADR